MKTNTEQYKYIEIEKYTAGIVVSLSDPREFRELMEISGVNLIYRIPGEDDEAETFAFTYQGVVYEIDARSYATIQDMDEGTRRGFYDGNEYYEAKKKGFPYIRNFSYFME